ncbi:hypothetical protein [Flagellimonas myxillae]|uniref:hypothetical protein n=1 Tax=Flagellimonas myxillae TaxID=2942214 RepID=UPI00201F1D23|nr:hypothetical protein [Muricauda myxillae]MCL6265355.1 hypothetical protein [Muricauda myxillae]
MNKLIVIFLLTLSNLAFGQESHIESEILSVLCDENSDAYRLNTILTKDSISNGTRIIHFSTSATCCVDFRIKSTLIENIVKMELEEDGVECECICAYDFVVRFNSVFDSKTKFFVNKRELRTDLPKVRPYEKRYFVYENDTTGFDDENGLRQGYMVLTRKNDMKKIYWKDGKFIKLEILDKKGYNL